jgi:hypothetical protein
MTREEIKTIVAELLGLGVYPSKTQVRKAITARYGRGISYKTLVPILKGIRAELGIVAELWKGERQKAYAIQAGTNGAAPTRVYLWPEPTLETAPDPTPEPVPDHVRDATSRHRPHAL